MSSDVYLDSCPHAIPNPSEHHCQDCDRQRIGHLGIMYYFGFDLLNELINLHSKLDEEWKKKAEILILQFKEISLLDQLLTPDQFTRMYGYIKPSEEEFEDYLHIKDLQTIFEEKKDQYIYIGWD